MRAGRTLFQTSFAKVAGVGQANAGAGDTTELIAESLGFVLIINCLRRIN